MIARSFSPALFAFLRDLAANNDREWFTANKQRYIDDVREPALAFVEDVGHRLPEISPRFVADPRTTGGSLFRIYRDTRFARDKSPYKTHAGIQFRHEQASHAHSPCFYLHLEPGNVFLAAGVWHPDGEALRAIRTAIATRPPRWENVVGSLGEEFRLGGDTLKRPPAGFDPDHPLIEDLKRKSFIATAKLTQREATAGDFLDRFLELCREASPLVRFVCEANGMRF
ncbi:MAG: hypothetical protein QOI80_2283 [Solirubrobacteraceae bacterium]|nr:hypothetical protein [Solirubrobacteraceae bacterium]